MKITYRKTREEICRDRQNLYLMRWPVSRQLEALSEAAAGRREKLDAMLKDFAEIREELRFEE